MRNMESTAIILAAGEGTRMKSSLHKVLHKLCGVEMVDYALAAAQAAGVERPVVVVGHAAEAVREHLAGRADFALQDKSTGWGTGHAVMSAQAHLQGEGKVYILAGVQSFCSTMRSTVPCAGTASASRRWRPRPSTAWASTTACSWRRRRPRCAAASTRP